MVFEVRGTNIIYKNLEYSTKEGLDMLVNVWRILGWMPFVIENSEVASEADVLKMQKEDATFLPPVYIVKFSKRVPRYQI